VTLCTVLRGTLYLSDYQQPPQDVHQHIYYVMTSEGPCEVCGVNALQLCSRCHLAHYCSTKHQKIHWQSHKDMCSSPPTCEVHFGGDGNGLLLPDGIMRHIYSYLLRDKVLIQDYFYLVYPTSIKGLVLYLRRFKSPS
jgi:hypothetical protein